MAYTTIDDPSAYFQTLLYTGNATGRSLDNTGNSNLKPDWIWAKKRSAVQNHTVTDSSRGVGNILFPDGTDAESATQLVTEFRTNGFGINNNALINDNSATYVAWQWKANGGTTASNTDGTITSTVQANTTAGFSIVTYTGNGSNATIGHGLGATPKVVIVKRRTESIFFWAFQHASIFDSNDTILSLNTNDAAFNQGGGNFNGTNPTNSVFSTGSGGNTNESAKTYVAYCFTEKKGYSKFSSFTGTGNADGPMVFCGFKPAWLMIKATGSTGGASNWRIADNKRSTSGSNPVEKQLEANTTNAEDSGNDVDLLSNGFKVRSTAAQWNASGVSIIYMAFAESPFVSSEGVPTTAR